VSRYAFYVRFTMLLALLAAASVLLGTEPWGPW
jgi:hypothetical protein